MKLDFAKDKSGLNSSGLAFLLQKQWKEKEMASRIHRRFTDDRVKLLLALYSKKAVSLDQILRQLDCTRSRFYQILKTYRHDPRKFTVAYGRNYPQHRLSKKIERAIREELEMDRQLCLPSVTTSLCRTSGLSLSSP